MYKFNITTISRIRLNMHVGSRLHLGPAFVHTTVFTDVVCSWPVSARVLFWTLSGRCLMQASSVALVVIVCLPRSCVSWSFLFFWYVSLRVCIPTPTSTLKPQPVSVCLQTSALSISPCAQCLSLQAGSGSSDGALCVMFQPPSCFPLLHPHPPSHPLASNRAATDTNQRSHRCGLYQDLVRESYDNTGIRGVSAYWKHKTDELCINMGYLTWPQARFEPAKTSSKFTHHGQL